MTTFKKDITYKLFKMKKLLLLLTLVIFVPLAGLAQDTFELSPSQSMLMTGKGPGQDGAINPYYGEPCYAIVSNNGNTPFSVRIQQDGEIIKTIKVKQKTKKEIKLLKKDELYIDASKQAKASLTLNFIPLGAQKKTPNKF